MILIDTNVLAYAVGGEHPLRDPCRRLIEAQRIGRLELATTVEVVQEFAHARARRRPRRDAVNLARLFTEAMTVIETGGDDLDHGLEIFADHPGLDAFDAVLAAVALRRNAQALVSADRGFAGITGLRHVAPGTQALDHLLDSRS